MKTSLSNLISCSLIIFVHTFAFSGVPRQGLVAQYTFTGSAVDSSRNGFDGTVAGATLTADRFGTATSAYSFNGSSSTIRCGDILDSVFAAQVAKFSVSGWAKTRTYGTVSGGGGFIIGKNSGGGVHGPAQWNVTHLDGVLYGAVFSDTLAQNFVALTSPMAKGQWFHFVLIFDGSLTEMQRVKLYVNAVSSNSSVFQHVGTLGTGTQASQQYLTIGASHPGGNPLVPENAYDGDVDDICIYNRVLSDHEIQAIYHDGGWPQALEPGLVAFYPFNGNANDSSGNAFNGLVIGASLVADRFGRPNSAYSFNGSTNYIRLGDILDSVFCKQVAQFSVSGWAKTAVPGTTSAGGGFIVGKESGGALPGGHQWNVAHLDTRLFCWVNSDSAALNSIDKTNPAPVNQWFYFVFIFDGSLARQDRIKIYVNGASNMGTYSQIGYLGTSTQNTSQELTIGAGHALNFPTIPNNAYNGAVDDIRIYNRVLSDQDIQALYHEGGWTPPSISPLAAYYPLNGNANDSSGNGHNGTVVGASPTSDRFGIGNRAYSFNGVNNVIRCGDILDSVFAAPIAKFTVAGWASTRTPGSVVGGGGLIVGKAAGGNAGPYQWAISHLDGKIFCSVFSDTASQNYVTLTNPMRTNVWFHFALVFNGSLPEMQRVALYVNSISNGDSVYKHVGTLGVSTQNSSQNLTIGAGHAANNPSSLVNLYDGNVDDIRIYSKALSQADIQFLYHEGNWAEPIDVPHIISIHDVPNDNGKQVLVSWKVAHPASSSGISKFSVRYWDKALLNWVIVRGDINAYPDTIHTTIAPTFYDSTKSKGMYYSVFQVAAHGVSPEIVTISPSDSGYSVDNLPPLAPTSLSARTVGGVAWIVSWKPASGQLGDFKNYVIYRSTTQNFVLDSTTRLGAVMDTVYLDNVVQAGMTYYYGITSIDYSGNESQPLTIRVGAMSVEQLQEGIPKDFELSENYPNPFNPSTTIRFGIPVRSRVTIEIYNVLGQLMTRLVNEDVEPGYYQKEWVAGASSGIYLCRIEAFASSDPNRRFVAAKKMLLLK